jgi:YhcH/YjgK/YiaL family protein
MLFLSCSTSRYAGQPRKETDNWFNERKWLNGLQLKPHETIDKDDFKKQYEANKQSWDKAFAYLKNTRFDTLKAGRHVIDENVYVLVTDAPATKDPTKPTWEAHHNYYDVHYVASGKENIGISPVTSSTLAIPYDEARDIKFYNASGKFYEADTNTFFIIGPRFAHCPGVKAAGYDGVVKKIVVKVRKSD